MAAVVFGPDQATRRSRPRIGRVLGAGGVLGAAWMTGEPDHPLQPHLRIERRVRQLITRALFRQAKALSAQGKRVTIRTPGSRDLAVMGANLMDPRRRHAMLEASFLTSADSLAQLGIARPRAA